MDTKKDVSPQKRKWGSGYEDEPPVKKLYQNNSTQNASIVSCWIVFT